MPESSPARPRESADVFGRYFEIPIAIQDRSFNADVQVVDREPLDDGAPRPPESWEAGFKDTVIAYPGELTRVKALFDRPGLFVWHCHIVEHEDNEMMRPYVIGPSPLTL